LFGKEEEGGKGGERGKEKEGDISISQTTSQGGGGDQAFVPQSALLDLGVREEEKGKRGRMGERKTKRSDLIHSRGKRKKRNEAGICRAILIAHSMLFDGTGKGGGGKKGGGGTRCSRLWKLGGGGEGNADRAYCFVAEGGGKKKKGREKEGGRRLSPALTRRGERATSLGLSIFTAAF